METNMAATAAGGRNEVRVRRFASVESVKLGKTIYREECAIR